MTGSARKIDKITCIFKQIPVCNRTMMLVTPDAGIIPEAPDIRKSGKIRTGSVSIPVKVRRNPVRVFWGVSENIPDFRMLRRIFITKGSVLIILL